MSNVTMMQSERNEHEPRHINTKDAQNVLLHESMSTRRRLQPGVISTADTAMPFSSQEEATEMRKQLYDLEYARNHVQDERAARLNGRAYLLDERALQLNELASSLQDERDLLGTLVPIGTQKEAVVSAALRGERLFTLEECRYKIRAAQDNVIAHLNGRKVLTQEGFGIKIGVERLAEGVTLSAKLSEPTWGKRFLTKDEYHDKMLKELLATRQKVLGAIARSKELWGKVEPESQAVPLGVWRKEIPSVCVEIFIFFALIGFLFLTLLVVGLFLTPSRSSDTGN